MLKKTKIICTQGPATEKPGVVDALIENGMNCARFNFSHGDHAEHLGRINMVREAAKRAGKVISLILDTKGPEMRLGEFRDGKVMLEKGKPFTLTYEDIPGDETHVSINHKGLYTEVKPGDTLLLSDGLVALKVDEIRGKDILTTIQNSGKMSTKKRVAAPGVSLGLPPISEQDAKDIVFGCEQDMDFVAASFIQRPEDVLAIRKLIEEHNGHMEILPKIENLEGVKNYRVLVSRANDTIVFLHKIVRGGASQSFGIEVASLAGVTKSVIDHAKSIMHSLEEDSKNRDTNEMLLSSAKKNLTAQVSLFDNEASKIEQQIKDIDVNNLTPLQALTVLCDLKKQLEE